jgi:hypothetical protein
MPRQRNGETFDKSSEIIKVHLQKIFTFIKTDSVLDEPSMIIIASDNASGNEDDMNFKSIFYLHFSPP